MTSLDKSKIVSILKYSATLGVVPGRPDLPELSFRTFEVIVRKYHNGFWVNFESFPESCTIKVSLCYHPNIGKIKRSLGGLTQVIQVEKLDLSITEEEDHLANIFLSVPSSTSQLSIPSTSSNLAPLSSPTPMTESTSTPPSSTSLPPSIPPLTLSSDLLSKKGKKRCATPAEKQLKKKHLKKNIYNDDLEKLLALEQICQKTLDGEFGNFEV